MSNYSNSPYDCRVDFFKPSGKWYATESITFTSDEYDMPLIHDAFHSALMRCIGGYYYGMTAVCLEPYHRHSHPLSIKWENPNAPNPSS